MKAFLFPLTKITIAFVLGILFFQYLKPNPSFIFILLFISSGILGGLYFLSNRKPFLNIYFGIITYLFSFLIGTTTQIVHYDYFQKDNYIHYDTVFEKPCLISVTLREKLKNSSFNDRYIAIVNNIDKRKSSGKIILNIRKDSLNKEFKIGSTLHINGILHKNDSSNNPNQFDYSKYLENKQIYAQLYCATSKVNVESKIEKNIWYYTSELRSKIIRNLEKSNFNKTELNVAIALILGQKQDVSPEIIQDYQFAGVIHILSVSGLHIGFILFLVTFMLKPLPNSKRGSFIKLIVILSSLSLFGLIAGLAPSVVRSVTMFSFVAVGTHLRRSVNIYHTLIVSILFILLFQPSFLFDVGFQLSYIAVFFIVWLQPLLASVWRTKFKVSKYIWDILTVSFAAQIGTLPLSIYYFHQFPGLFFLSNLIVIPLLSFIMTLGVLVMVLAAFNFTPPLFVKTLEWCIYYLDKIINSIASLEQFIIHDIPFNIYLFIGAYLLIITIVIWFKKPNFNKLIAVLIACLFLQISFTYNQWDTQNQKEWIVFNSKKNTLITERNGKNVTLYANDSILKTSQKNKTLNSYLVDNFSVLKSKKPIQNAFFFNGKKILIIDSLGIYPKNCNPDIIILIQSPKLNLERLFQTIRPKMVVADASNYKMFQKNWESTCRKNKIPFHATNERGFYRLK